jgi:hypothetical protein
MILGILVAHIAGTHWLYIDLFIPVLVFLTVYLKVFNYTFYALFNTIIAVMLVCLIAPGDWQIAYVRMEMTLLGCLIALAATYWLLPNRTTELLPEQMQQLRLSLKTYYLSLIQPFLENENTHSKLHRQSIGQILEKMDTQLQEARYESWSWKHPLRQAQNPQEKTYNDLQQCYQTLLLLELEWPDPLQHPNLQAFKPRLKEVLQAIADLFDSATPPINSLKHSLQDMLSQVKAIRMKGAQDIRLPVATYHEHIQLTESLQHLLKLVTLFSAVKK